MELQANRLGEMLLEAGLIDQFQLESALSMQRNLGGRIGSALVKLGYLPEETILEFLESQSKYARVSLTELEIPADLISLLPFERLEDLLVVPIELRRDAGEKTLRVAMTDPTNLKLIDDLQFATSCKILPVFAAEGDIREALENNRPQLVPEPPQPVMEDAATIAHNNVDFTDLPIDDPRMDRLLDVLKEKGVLSILDIERIKYD